MFYVGTGGSKDVLTSSRRQIPKTGESNGVKRRGVCAVYLPVLKKPPPSVAKQLETGVQQVVFLSRDVDQIFSANNKLSAERIEYSCIMSSMGYCVAAR